MDLCEKCIKIFKMDSTTHQNLQKRHHQTTSSMRKLAVVLLSGAIFLAGTAIGAPYYPSPRSIAGSSPHQRYLQQSRSSSRMVRSGQPVKKWVNPCGLMETDILPPKEFIKNLPSRPQDPTAPPSTVLLGNIARQAEKARRNAQHVKEFFVNTTFGGQSDFEESTRSFRQAWLPPIPRLSHSALRDMTPEHALRISFEFMQYFAVGLEQILLDHVLHDASSKLTGSGAAVTTTAGAMGMTSGEVSMRLKALFKELEFDLYGLMCELQLAMHMRRVHPRRHIMEDVMSHKYRDIPETSLRNFRDFLILRDYIKAIDFVTEASAYFSQLPSDMMMATYDM